MDAYGQLTALIELAEKLGVTVRPSPSSNDGGEHPGGAVVRLKGRCVVFLDASAAPGEQVDVLLAALRKRDELQDMYLRPELRELLEGPAGT